LLCEKIAVREDGRRLVVGPWLLFPRLVNIGWPAAASAKASANRDKRIASFALECTHGIAPY